MRGRECLCEVHCVHCPLCPLCPLSIVKQPFPWGERMSQFTLGVPSVLWHKHKIKQNCPSSIKFFVSFIQHRFSVCILEAISPFVKSLR